MTEDKLHQKVESLECELSELRAELGRLVQVARETAAEGAGAGGDTTREGSPEPPRDHLERKVEAAVETGERLLGKLDEMAERHPVGSLVVAFTVGVIAARILGIGRNR